MLAAILGALVAIAAILGFALYTLRLVRRISAREQDLEQTVASLSATIVDFRGIHTGLKCAGELVPARFTPIPPARIGRR